ncbi:MAG: ATP-grasp domain-containing protein [Thermodesulfobacteriota bacterium]
MRLIESDGKRLFSKYGIPVPKGTLWPDIPPQVNHYVVKAQMARGGRGKLGGIRFVKNREHLIETVNTFLLQGLAGEKVEYVYIEEQIDIVKEFYLAVTMDRDIGALSIIATPQGGIEVESSSSAGLLRLPLDPLSGYQPTQGRKLCSMLGLEGNVAAKVEAIAAALCQLAITEDAILAEINPLAVTTDGSVIAADAKVELDPNAGFRHPDRSGYVKTEEPSDFERQIAKAHSVGVEIDSGGNILGIVSGAGAMMAILDLLASHSVRVRAMVDLGGTANIDSKAMEIILEATDKLNPKAVLIAGYLQTAHCDRLAQAIVDGLNRKPLKAKVLVRLKGRGDDLAMQILGGNGLVAERNLANVIQRAVEIASQRENDHGDIN